MKKNLLVLTILASATTMSFSQKKNLTSAIMLAKKNQFVKAKPYIDKAIAHEDTKNKAKTWIWKANVYAGILGSKKESAVALREKQDISSIVMEAMTMTKKLDKKGDYRSDLRKLAAPMFNNSRNAGISSYNSKDYASALKSFTNSQEYGKLIGMTDSTGAYYGGLAAEMVKDYDQAILNYSKCVEIGFKGADAYLNLMNAYNKAEKPEEAAKVLEAAKAKFPNNANIILNEVKKLLGEKKPAEAKVALEKALAKDANNYALQYAAGITYNEMEMYDEAITAYKKALELKPADYNSQFNMCVVYNNIVAEKNEVVNAIPLNESAKFDKEKDAMKTYIKEVLPFVETAYAVEKEAALKRILNNFYNITRQADKIIK